MAIRAVGHQDNASLSEAYFFHHGLALMDKEC